MRALLRKLSSFEPILPTYVAVVPDLPCIPCSSLTLSVLDIPRPDRRVDFSQGSDV
jgi:hypothetical protein